MTKYEMLKFIVVSVGLVGGVAVTMFYANWLVRKFDDLKDLLVAYEVRIKSCEDLIGKMLGEKLIPPEK